MEKYKSQNSRVVGTEEKRFPQESVLDTQAVSHRKHIYLLELAVLLSYPSQGTYDDSSFPCLEFDTYLLINKHTNGKIKPIND